VGHVPRTAARFLAFVAPRRCFAHARANTSTHALALRPPPGFTFEGELHGWQIRAQALRTCFVAPGLSRSVFSASNPAAGTGALDGSSCDRPVAQW